MELVSDHNRILTTPPRWGRLCGFVGLLLTYAIIWMEAELKATHPGNIFFLILFVLTAFSIFTSGMHYTIRNEGIVVKWLNVPIRIVKWEQIGYAEYIHIWKDVRHFYTDLERGLVSGQIIYVTLKGRPRYYPRYDVRTWHSLMHPLGAMCIRLPRDTKYQYIDLFKCRFQGTK